MKRAKECAIAIFGEPIGTLEVKGVKISFTSYGVERCCSHYLTEEDSHIEFIKMKKIIGLELENEEYRGTLTVEKALDIVDYTFGLFNDLKAMYGNRG